MQYYRANLNGNTTLQNNTYPTFFNYQLNDNNLERNINTERENPRSTLRNRIIQSIIDLVVIGIIFAAFGIVYAKLDPVIRHFHCSDTDIFFPVKKDTVPIYAVAIYGVISPILMIILVEALNAKLFPFQNKRSQWRQFVTCILHAISLFVLGLGITLLLTEIGKRWIGRLRPHFMAVCNPDLTIIKCKTANDIFETIDTGGSFCRGEAKAVKEARFSFPSGHSSFSTYTMLFLILYIQARLILYKFRFVKPLIQLTAFIAAFVTCISRIGDYHHRGTVK
jgi:phosphatidate phosphatase